MEIGKVMLWNNGQSILNGFEVYADYLLLNVEIHRIALKTEYKAGVVVVVYIL